MCTTCSECVANVYVGVKAHLCVYVWPVADMMAQNLEIVLKSFCEFCPWNLHFCDNVTEFCPWNLQISTIK